MNRNSVIDLLGIVEDNRSIEKEGSRGGGGLHSTEVAFLYLTQQPRV